MEIVAENLSVHRGSRAVVREVSFRLPAGGVLTVTGENGSGKSTLLRALAGLLPLASGKLGMTGESRGKQAADHEIRELCHYLGHLNAMKNALTVRENLSFWRAFCGEPDLIVEAALERVDLSHAIDLPFGYLSAGQKRRASIARLLVSHKPLWIVDEPTSALNSASSERFREIIAHHCASGGMVVAATHLPLGIANSGQLHLERLRENYEDAFIAGSEAMA